MSKARRKFTRIMLLSVSAIGLLSAMLLLTDPPSPVSASTSFLADNSNNVSQRNPASADGAGPDALMEINCTELNQILETTSARFRIKGPACVPKGMEVLSTKVQNKTNGYVATVFRQSAQFTTDYINLTEGKNSVDVRFETEKGPVEKVVTVFRNPASNPLRK